MSDTFFFSGTAFFAATRKVAPPSPLLSDGERAGSDGEDASRKPTNSDMISCSASPPLSPNSDSVSCGISSIFSTSSDLVSCARFPLSPTNSDSISCSALPCLRRIPTRFRAALSPAFDEFRLSFVHPRFPVPADFRLGFVQTSFDFLPKSERLPTKTHVRLVQIHYIWCFNHAPISNLLELIFFSSARFQVVLSQTSA